MKRERLLVMVCLFALPCTQISAQGFLGKMKKAAEKVGVVEQKDEKQTEMQVEKPAVLPKQEEVATGYAVPHLTPATIWISGLAVHSDMECFSDDMLWVEDAETHLWGYINKKGERVIPCKYKGRYDQTCAFDHGYAVVTKEVNYKTRFFIIDKTGKETPLPETYSRVSDFKDGRALVRKMVNYKTSVIYIDTLGKEIYPGLARASKEYLDDSAVPRDFCDGLAAFFDAEKGLWGFYDRSGKLAITPVYKEVDDFSEGLAAVLVVDKELQKERWGFIDTAGNVMIEPAFKERPYRFSEGYVVVQTSNGLYQMIDKTGKPYGGEFNRLCPFKDGYAYARDDNRKVLLLDKDLKPVPGFSADFVMPQRDGLIELVFLEGLSAVGAGNDYRKIGGKAIIDPKGTVHIGQGKTNVSIRNFFNGLAYCYARVKDDGSYVSGFVDKTGAYILAFDK